MTNLHPDHMALLSLARAAFVARDDRQLWRRNTEAAAEEHAVACNALWDELERQVAMMDGLVPVLDHPSVRLRKMAARMRGEIVAAVQNAVIDTLEELEHGPFLEADE